MALFISSIAVLMCANVSIGLSLLKVYINIFIRVCEYQIKKVDKSNISLKSIIIFSLR